MSASKPHSEPVRDVLNAWLAFCQGRSEVIADPDGNYVNGAMTALAALDSLEEQYQALREEMQFINDAAMSFHKGEEGKSRALNVIGARSGNALLASNPASVPLPKQLSALTQSDGTSNQDSEPSS